MEISGGVKLAASDSKNTGNARFDRRNAFKCRIAARLLRRLIPQKPLDSTRRVRVVGGPLIHDALTSTCVHACTHACTHAARNQKQRERERETERERVGARRRAGCCVNVAARIRRRCTKACARTCVGVTAHVLCRCVYYIHAGCTQSVCREAFRSQLCRLRDIRPPPPSR